MQAPPIALDLSLRARLFHGLSDRSRLSILEALRGGATTVTEIVAESGLSQPNVSNHLRCLRECGLVACEPDGRFVHYRLSDPRVAALLTLADELLRDVASGVASCTRSEMRNHG